ncbi:hypothetical protein OQJ26_08660 [Legionella sp. PATHC038]|uniref:hypothetical protein n=1 Tax=Legionella sheltonii TaxID=2992041 RepID=UPI002244461C|nr:hypothetical protein [Legionella sp. PATHC038]MCW8398860.1 hypothetical protein [Legionella sp. PATHC038]
MGRLFQDKRKDVNRIIGNFVAAEARSGDFFNKLNALQNELYTVKTKQEFDIVVQKLINEEKNVHQFLSELITGADQEILSKVMVQLASQPNLKHVIILFNYTSLVAQSVADKNESLSMQESLVGLSDEQRTALLLFITKLKELKPIAALLVNQEEVFKALLQQTNSLDDLDQIETEIENKNRLLDGALERLLPYPKDELVAGQIINILKANRHLLKVLQSFDLHETLMDDILNARARILTHTDSYASAQPVC